MSKLQSRGHFEQVPLARIAPLLEGKRPPRILIVGHDPLLVETRSAILQNSGLRAIGASSAAEAARISRREEFDALVLCHELSQQDKQMVMQEARRRKPRSKVIALYSITPSEASGADLAVDSHDGPEAFLEAVHSIL